MKNAEFVANFYIKMASLDITDTITNLRLNKLMFFSQSWSLAETSKPLFNDNFETWEYGPVIPSVYKKYKKYGKNNIDSIDTEYSINAFTPTEADILLRSFSYFNRYSTTWLVSITHAEGAPWSQSINKKSKIIPQELIRKSFMIPSDDIKKIHVYMIHDSSTDTWTVISKDLSGLVAEGKSYNESIQEAYLSASDLLEEDLVDHHSGVRIIPENISAEEAEREGIL